MARIGVVVVTYRSDDVLAGLLDSVAEHEPDAWVVVVDDASPDGPPEIGDRELIRMPDNAGYATCANRGVDALRRQDVEHVAFLNPDVRLTGPSLTAIADALDARPEVGIATGPVVDEIGRRLPSAWGPTSVRRAMTFAAGFEPSRLRSAAGESVRTRGVSSASRSNDDLRVEGHVMAGTMVVRLACFDEIGGFDEEFFLYWEDADLCHRARDAGWGIRILPCDPFQNIRPPATIDDEERWELFVRSAERFGSKHLVPGQARQLDAALQLGRRLGRLRQRG